MQVISFKESVVERVSLALGFFDCVHSGHVELLKRAKQIAQETGCKSAVFTFRTTDDTQLKQGSKLVYTLNERLARFEEEGIDVVIVADFDEAFKEISAEGFLEILFERFSIAHLSVGTDYRFGKGAKGEVALLKMACEKKNVGISVLEEVRFEGDRISTSRIREALSNGDVAFANELLGAPYRITGCVEHGHRIGHKLGFPTANITLSKEKFLLKNGVYAGFCTVDGKTFRTVTNVGARPTFGDENCKVEAYLDGFSGDLYGREITLFFTKHVRDIKTFDNMEELSAQIAKDLEAALND